MDGLLLSLAGLLLVWGAFSGAGRAVVPRASWAERTAMGALLLSLAVSALGWSSLLHPWTLWIVVALPLVLSVARPGSLGPGSAWPFVFASIVLLLPLAAMPQTARDAMNHHLYLPRLWLEAGAIHRPAWSPFFFYPYLVESLYALLGGTAGFRAAGMLSLLGFSAAVGAAFGAASRHGRRAGVLAAIVLSSMPEVFRNATWAYSDSFLLLFSILALDELWKDDGSPLLAAVWGAAAGACKYNGLPVTAMVLLVLAWRNRRSLGRLVLPTGAALLICSTWAVPNLVETGNPVHPLFGGIFGDTAEVSGRASELLDAFSDYSASVRTPGDLLLLPIRMSTTGRWDDPRLYDGSSGPLLLLGVLLFLLLGRDRKRIIPLLILLAATVLLCGAAVRVRYLFGALGMLAIPAAEGLDRVLSSGRIARAAGLAVIAVSLIWSGNWLIDLYRRERPWEAMEEDFLEKRLPYMSFYNEVDRVLEPGDTTLFLDMGNRSFYFPSYSIYNSRRFPLDVLEPLWAGCGPEDLAGMMRARGASWVAIDMDMADINITGELDEGELAVWREFVALRMEPVVSEGPYILFRLLE